MDEIVIKDINTGEVVEVLLGFLLYVEKSNTHKNLLFHKLEYTVQKFDTSVERI